MRRYLLLFILILLGGKCFAFDVVYPKNSTVTINAKSTFFIGSSKTPLKINGQNVPLHWSGGFAYVVNLNEGTNTFTLQSENEKKIFIINKPAIKSSGWTPPQFFKYPDNKHGYVVNENSPLRSTPVDAGINRLAHLQRNVLLTIDGEKNGFYRVVLGENKFGWIAKTNVKLGNEYEFATFYDYDFIDDEKFYIYKFHFDKKVPFELSENIPLTIKFFNIKDKKDNTFSLEFPQSLYFGEKNLIGYGGEYQDNDFIWKIKKIPNISPKKPLKNIIITIDAGHGGSENGAIGCLGDKEKDITLAISKLLEAELKQRGAKVIMTRSDDSYVGLKERVDIANYDNSEVLISIHGNALPDGADPNKNSGTSIYYYYNQSKPLADTIIETMTSELGLNNDKVRQASFALVRNTNALSILIETAYLINPEDNAKLISADFQKEIAKSIANGLEKYFGNLK